MDYAFSKNPVLFARMSSLTSANKLQCCVVNMLLNGIIHFDGMIDFEHITQVKKRELWAYLYYIWLNNRTLKEFENPPTPENFADLVLKQHGISSLYVTKHHLAYVINSIIVKNRDIKISVISNLLNKIQEKISKEEVVLQNAIQNIEKELLKPQGVATIKDNQGNPLPHLDFDIHIKEKSTQ